LDLLEPVANVAGVLAFMVVTFAWIGVQTLVDRIRERREDKQIQKKFEAARPKKIGLN
jgi:hypothetical protein